MTEKNCLFSPFYKEFYFMAEEHFAINGYSIRLHVVYDTYTDIFERIEYNGLSRDAAGFILETLSREETHLTQQMSDDWLYLETI